VSNDFPAFPFEYENENGVRFSHNGMSMRDWFAGQALASTTDAHSAEELAAKCYRLADAMLKARTLSPTERT
jgi:hypothetical protein